MARYAPLSPVVSALSAIPLPSVWSTPPTQHLELQRKRRSQRNVDDVRTPGIRRGGRRSVVILAEAGLTTMAASFPAAFVGSLSTGVLPLRIPRWRRHRRGHRAEWSNSLSIRKSHRNHQTNGPVRGNCFCRLKGMRTTGS